MGRFASMAVRDRAGTLLRFAVRPVPAASLMAFFNFAVCYFRSFIFPCIPVVLGGDQVGYFNNGSRFAAGQMPYRDYFEIVPPGTDLVYALLIKAFGVRVWIPNLLMAILAAAAAMLMTWIASRLMQGAMVLLPGLFLAGLVLPASMDATHHWFSAILTLAASAVLLPGTSLRRVAAAGALCGLAACFTQSEGAIAAAALSAYLVFCARRSQWQAGERWRKYLLPIAMAAAVFAAANAYFVRIAGLGRWLFCLAVYPLRYYSAPSVNNWRVPFYEFRWHAGIAMWASFPFLYASIPLVYIAFAVDAVRRSKEDRDESWREALLVAILGFAMLLAIVSAPSVKRLAAASPTAMILLAWLLGRPGRAATVLKALLGGVAVVFAIASPTRVQTRSHSFLVLPAGRAAFLDPAVYEEYRWLRENTQPGQYFFGLATLYSAFHMKNPAAIEGYDPSEYTRPEQALALVDALASHPVPLLVLRRSREFLRATESPSDHLGPFREYVSRNYRLIKTFPTGDDVWQRIGPQPLM